LEDKRTVAYSNLSRNAACTEALSTLLENHVDTQSAGASVCTRGCSVDVTIINTSRQYLVTTEGEEIGSGSAKAI
jgi:hypothetical protein